MTQVEALVNRIRDWTIERNEIEGTGRVPR